MGASFLTKYLQCAVIIISFLKNQKTVTLDHDSGDNLFINYLSRVHRDHDLEFVLEGFTRLLNNPLQSSLLPTKKVGQMRLTFKFV